MKSEVRHIIENISHSYGSLSDPNWNFVASIYKERFMNVAVNLSFRFTLKIQVDINYDVSFWYEIQKEDGHFYLALSMVGPYAIILRENIGLIDINVPAGLSGYSDEDYIRKVCLASGIIFLSESVLNSTIEMNLYGEGLESVSLFNILFSNEGSVDGLKSCWKSKSR